MACQKYGTLMTGPQHADEMEGAKKYPAKAGYRI